MHLFLNQSSLPVFPLPLLTPETLVLTLRQCTITFLLIHSYTKNKNSTMKWRYGAGERPYAWSEIKFTVLPLTSVNSIFHLHFLYLYTPRVSDILKSQLFFSWRPIWAEANSTDSFPSLPVRKLGEGPTLLLSTFMSTASCLRVKFGKEE